MEKQSESVESQKSIKEISEVLDGLKIIGVAGAKVLADGKLSVTDVPALIELAKNHGILVEAVKGADQVVPEAKDLDMSELAVIGAKALEIVKAVKSAYGK